MNISNGTVNRVELRGHVGQEPRVSLVGESTVARFTMATNEIYRDRTGSIVEETTWHSVTAWSGKGMPPFSSIHKGTVVTVKGRIRNNRYTDKSTGEDRLFWEILANSIVVESESRGERDSAAENV